MACRVTLPDTLTIILHYTVIIALGNGRRTSHYWLISTDGSIALGNDHRPYNQNGHPEAIIGKNRQGSGLDKLHQKGDNTVSGESRSQKSCEKK